MVICFGLLILLSYWISNDFWIRSFPQPPAQPEDAEHDQKSRDDQRDKASRPRMADGFADLIDEDRNAQEPR